MRVWMKKKLKWTSQSWNLYHENFRWFQTISCMLPFTKQAVTVQRWFGSILCSWNVRNISIVTEYTMNNMTILIRSKAKIIQCAARIDECLPFEISFARKSQIVHIPYSSCSMWYLFQMSTYGCFASHEQTIKSQI